MPTVHVVHPDKRVEIVAYEIATMLNAVTNKEAWLASGGAVRLAQICLEALESGLPKSEQK